MNTLRLPGLPLLAAALAALLTMNQCAPDDPTDPAAPVSTAPAEAPGSGTTSPETGEPDTTGPNETPPTPETTGPNETPPTPETTDAASDTTDAGAGAPTPVVDGKRCTLHLHWAGGSGVPDATTMDRGGFWEVWPDSPDGDFWLYDGPRGFGRPGGDAESEAAFDAIVSYLSDYLDERQCGPVMVIGYSNGGGLAAKLLCRGIDFGGRVWAVMVDDPVMDAGVRGCAPSPLVREVVFTHSEELRDAALVAGGDCLVTGAYCENGWTMPVEEYQSLTGFPSVLSREFHAGEGWEDVDHAPFMVQYTLWTERFAG